MFLPQQIDVYATIKSSNKTNHIFAERCTNGKHTHTHTHKRERGQAGMHKWTHSHEHKRHLSRVVNKLERCSALHRNTALNSHVVLQCESFEQTNKQRSLWAIAIAIKSKKHYNGLANCRVSLAAPSPNAHNFLLT